MDFYAIRSKRTYWTVREELAGNASIRREVKTSIYILVVDYGEKKLLVSINGRPPQWIPNGRVHNWLEYEPSCRGWYEIEIRDEPTKKKRNSLVVC